MIDLLSSAVRLGRAALQPSTHTAESKLPLPPKKKGSNYAPLRTLSRAFQGANNFVFSLWDGLTADERERKRATEERKTLLIFHMKNVGTNHCFCIPRNSYLATAYFRGTAPQTETPLHPRAALRVFDSSSNVFYSNRPTALNNGRQPHSSSTRSRVTTSGSLT